MSVYPIVDVKVALCSLLSISLVSNVTARTLTCSGVTLVL